MVIPDPSHSVALWTFVAEQRQEWGCIGGDGKQRKKATFWSQLSFISALNDHETTSTFTQVKKSPGCEHCWDVTTYGQKCRWSIPSHPWPHHYQETCSSICTMKNQDLLYPTSSSSFLMLSIYKHYLAHPLHRIKSVPQGDPQLPCLAVKTFKVDVGSSVAKIVTTDFVI